MKIALVILNWNGKDLLKQFLPSVIKNSPQADIYVIDNASTDNSVDFINSKFPEINTIINTKNEGYAKGYNIGLKQIDADVYGLLNSDVEVTENWLNPILKKYTTDSKTCIIQPKILDYKEQSKFEYAGAAGGYIDKYGYAFCKGRIFNTIEKDENQYQSSEISWASGAALFIKKRAFDDLNGFDEDFFAHYEEIDLCWRAKNKNLKIESVLESTVYHVGGATLSNNSPFKTYLNFRNSLFTLVKNLPKNKLFPIIFTRMVLDGVAGVKFILTLDFKSFYSILKAHISFYKKFRLMYKKRTSHQNKQYYINNNIVFSYFLKKHSTFNDIKLCQKN